MRVSSINSFNQYNCIKNKQSFKHTAVPYPEFENSYKTKPASVKFSINNIISRISELFHPQVSKDAKEIKNQIDKIYDKKSADKHLVSALA